MSNRLEELQAQCKRYHLKRSLKAVWILIGILIVVIGIYLLIISIYPHSVQTDNKRVMSLLKKDLPKQENYTLDVSSDMVAQAVAKMQSQKPEKKEPVSTVQIKKQTQKPMKTEKKAVFIEELPKQTLFINVNEEKPLESWIEKYNQKKSYALAIYIAKQYYFDSDYKNSGIWAKRANQLDRNKEEAWLFYAKSVYALGDTEKAKRILNIFLQYKDSTKAELLLSEWSQRGE
ncbi:hypothetical protein ACFLR3_03640 [Campylobacterota bacterium]